MDSDGKESKDSSGKKDPPNTAGSDAPIEETHAMMPSQGAEDVDDIKTPSASSPLNDIPAMRPGAVAVCGTDGNDDVELQKARAGASINENVQDEATVPVETEPLVLKEDAEDMKGPDDEITKDASREPTIADLPIADGAATSGALSKEYPSPTNDQSTPFPMVQAELVAPPVQAYNVAIDEDSPGIQPLEIEVNETRINRKSPHGKNRNMLLTLIAVLLILLLVAAISIPLVLLRPERTKGQRDSDDSLDSNDLIGLPSPAPAPAPTRTFSYPCFTSTWDILQAQRDKNATSIDDDTNGEDEVYIICPNTTIEIGAFRNPAANDYSFVNGDYPLWIIRQNVTVKCGIDGKLGNNCVFFGGFIQILLQSDVPTPDGGFSFNQSIDNLKVQGITFSGQVVDTSPFTGLSVQVSNPGKNIRFENCMWTDMVVPSGLFSVSTNSYLERTGIHVDDMSIDVTLSNCKFQNIIYDNPLLHVRQQSLLVERCLFQNVSLTALSGARCHPSSDLWVFVFENGCSGLMYCEPKSVCSLTDICVENFEYTGPSLVFLAEANADNYFENLYLDRSESTDCDLATARVGEENAYNCSQIFTEDTCPIDLPSY